MEDLKYEVVQSHTDPTRTYVLTVVDEYPVSCSCPRWARETKKGNMPFLCKHGTAYCREAADAIDLDTVGETGIAAQLSWLWREEVEPILIEREY